LENASCDKARPAHLLAAQSFLPSAWKSPRMNRPIRYRAGAAHLILHFEDRSHGIAWRFLGQCKEKKEEQGPVHGRDLKQTVYEARKPRYLCFLVKLCASKLSFFPSFVHLRLAR
jgi:hypothetical protein